MQNRNRANIILAAVFSVFIILTILKYIFRGNFMLDLLAFAAEASLVGGIADWFAVTALFRKPLGFSWHTAIVPKNRGKIIEKISDIVSKELLSVEAVKSKLTGIELTDAILDRMSEVLDKAAMESSFREFFGDKADELDKTKLTEDMESFIKEGLGKENVSSSIRGILVDSFSEGRQREWLSSLLARAAEVAARPATRDRIYDILRKQEKLNEASTGAGTFFVRTLLNVSRSSKHTNLFTISGILQKELTDTIIQIGNGNHPIFDRLVENSAHFVERMDEDDVLVQVIQTWKNGILERADLTETLEKIVASIIESRMHRDEAAQWLASHLDSYWRELRQDAGMKQWVDDILKNMLEKIIMNEHHLIGEVVGETLESFTNERLVQFIEEKAGNDLQWIRINGSIVGAAAGIVLYLFTNLFYGPFVIPLIQRLLKYIIHRFTML